MLDVDGWKDQSDVKDAHNVLRMTSFIVLRGILAFFLHYIIIRYIYDHKSSCRFSSSPALF